MNLFLIVSILSLLVVNFLVLFAISKLVTTFTQLRNVFQNFK